MRCTSLTAYFLATTLEAAVRLLSRREASAHSCEAKGSSCCRWPALKMVARACVAPGTRNSASGPSERKAVRAHARKSWRAGCMSGLVSRRPSSSAAMSRMLPGDERWPLERLMILDTNGGQLPELHAPVLSTLALHMGNKFCEGRVKLVCLSAVAWQAANCALACLAFQV